MCDFHPPGWSRKPVLSEARIAAGTSAAAAANETTALTASRSSGSKPHSEAGLVEEHVICIFYPTGRGRREFLPRALLSCRPCRYA
jgi:hypothetical protein